MYFYYGSPDVRIKSRVKTLFVTLYNFTTKYTTLRGNKILNRYRSVLRVKGLGRGFLVESKLDYKGGKERRRESSRLREIVLKGDCDNQGTLTLS